MDTTQTARERSRNIIRSHQGHDPAPKTDSSLGEENPSGPHIPVHPPGMMTRHRRRERAPSVPTLDTAAFLGQPRDRSVSWEELRAKRTLGEVQDHSDEAGLSTPATLSDLPGEPQPVMGATMHESSPPVPETCLPPPADDTATPMLSRETTTPPMVVSSRPSAPEGLRYDVLLGATAPSPQYGLLGEVAGRKVALDLNQTHTVSLFGVQGGGKSYTLGTIVEMASLPIAQVNQLPQPLATVIFHYSPTMDYRPEFTSMVLANSDADQIQALQEHYGAVPKALSDVILLVPGDKLQERQDEFPALEVYPLQFAAAELQTSHWRFLMGAVGNQATYIRQLNRVMRSLRNDLTLDDSGKAFTGRISPSISKTWPVCAWISQRPTSTTTGISKRSSAQDGLSLSISVMSSSKKTKHSVCLSSFCSSSLTPHTVTPGAWNRRLTS
jgi:DNA phosphorothioation-dependent restriction protein DptH